MNIDLKITVDLGRETLDLIRAGSVNLIPEINLPPVEQSKAEGLLTVIAKAKKGAKKESTMEEALEAEYKSKLDSLAGEINKQGKGASAVRIRNSFGVAKASEISLENRPKFMLMLERLAIGHDIEEILKEVGNS